MFKRFMPDRRLSRTSLRRRWRLVGQPMLHGPRSRLRVGIAVGLNNVLINTYGGYVDIGDYVFFGHDVQLLTGTHEFREAGPKRQLTRRTLDRSIVIEPGAWITSGSIIVGPCRIGANAVIGCGCVIDFDVLPDTIVRVRQDFTKEKIRYLDMHNELRERVT
jgi:acetyltransferase-like isoleucine patch superfamily enzyme